MRVLVTGGAGFVGSNLCLSFKADRPDDEVIALDNLKRDGSYLNIPRFKAAGIEFRHGDIRNREDLEDLGPLDLIVEASAEPSVLAGFDSSPAYLLNTNLVGTLNCLELARRSDARFLFLSTSRIYPHQRLNDAAWIEKETRFELADEQSTPGLSARGVAEDFPLEGARSLYGATKLASELIIHEYVDMYGLKALVNRCGVLTGPWQMGKVDQGVVVLWVARHMFGRPLAYIGFGGTGKQVRDILHVDDLFELLKLQLADEDAWGGEVFNVGGGVDVSVSLQELTRLCEQSTGATIDIRAEVEGRPADLTGYLTDCAKVTGRFGWRPTRSTREVVDDIRDWINQHRDGLAAVLS